MGGRVYPWLIGAATLALALGAAGCGRSEVFFAQSDVAAFGTSGSGSGGATAGGNATNGTSSGTTTGVVLPPVQTLAGNGTPSSASTPAYADGSGGPTGQAEFNGPEGSPSTPQAMFMWPTARTTGSGRSTSPAT